MRSLTSWLWGRVNTSVLSSVVKIKSVCSFSVERTILFLRDVVCLFIFQLAGIAVVSVGIWMLTDATMYLNVVQNDANFHTGIYVMIAAGALMFIVGFLGCCGALRESPCMLVTVSDLLFCFDIQ